jgi:hypothetical protein
MSGAAAKPELIEQVRNYVHFDNLAESLTKQVTNVRNMRKQFEEKILKSLETTGMRNAVLQINGATLQRETEVKQQDLSWSCLEEQLQNYFRSKGRSDETKQIIDFVRKNRPTKTSEYLKKTLSADSSSKKPPSS